MHNTMRNTFQNGISHSITSVLSIKQRISHSFSSLSKTFLIDFPSDSKYFFTMDCNETRSKKRVYYKAKEASDYYEVKPS